MSRMPVEVGVAEELVVVVIDTDTDETVDDTDVLIEETDDVDTVEETEDVDDEAAAWSWYTLRRDPAPQN